jgi:deazaflavin-dependent oxidoreductase (nitroreductase family)
MFPAHLRTGTVSVVQRLVAMFTHHTARSRLLAAAWGRIHATTLRATRGRVGAKWFGAPMLVLITTGRRSGKVRETPLIYVRDGDDLVLMAANGGNDRVPAWWLNLQAAETAGVLLRGRRREMRWRETTGEERARLFDAFVAEYPPAAFYPGYTGRELPVVVLRDVA